MNEEHFKNYLKINVDSENSQVNYLSQVRCFFKKHNEFNQVNVDDYLAHRIDKKVSKQTFNSTIASLRQYSKFCKTDIELPKYKWGGSSIKDYLTEDEMLKELLPYFSRIFEKNWEFYSFVVKFLMYTGIRPSEMGQILSKEMMIDKNIFIVRDPKDHDDKIVPFPDCLKDDIKKFSQPNSIYIFKITYQQIQYIFNKINIQLKYKKKLNSYMLRHSYAHYCLDNGVPIEKLQLLMGHSDLRTTMIYAKPRFEDALSSYFKNIQPKGK